MDEKQLALDLMEAQGLAIEIFEKLGGHKTGVVSVALSSVLAEFGRTCTGDPKQNVLFVTQSALNMLVHAAEPGPERVVN